MSVKSIVDEVKKLTALELKELVESIEETFGVSAAAATAVAAPVAAADGEAESAEEKSSFNVVLKSPGDQKIKIIKALRALIPGLGLTEAKALIDEAPSTVKEGVNKEDAAAAKKALEEAGGVVEIS